MCTSWCRLFVPLKACGKIKLASCCVFVSLLIYCGLELKCAHLCMLNAKHSSLADYLLKWTVHFAYALRLFAEVLVQQPFAVSCWGPCTLHSDERERSCLMRAGEDLFRDYAFTGGLSLHRMGMIGCRFPHGECLLVS